MHHHPFAMIIHLRNTIFTIHDVNHEFALRFQDLKVYHFLYFFCHRYHNVLKAFFAAGVACVIIS